MNRSFRPPPALPPPAAGRRGVWLNRRVKASWFAPVLFLILALAAGNATAVPGDGTIKIATGLWEPYISGEPCELAGETTLGSSLDEFTACQDRFQGPFIDVVRQAYAGAGIEVEFVSHPWTRNAQLIESGVVDAGLPYYCSEARAEQYICSESVVDGEMVLFHRSDTHFDWNSAEDLQGYTIGATLGYFYGEQFEAMERAGELKVLRVAQDEVNMKLLVRGLVDLLPQDKAVGYATARKVLPRSQWSAITHHPKALHSRPLHLIFTRATERGAYFAGIFADRLEAMKASGELEEALRPLQQMGIMPAARLPESTD